MKQFVLLGAGEGDQVPVLVQRFEAGIIQTVDDDGHRLGEPGQVLRQDGEESVHSRLADHPSAGLHAFRRLAEVMEGVMEESGIAATNDDSISSWGSLTGARNRGVAKPSHGEGGNVQVPLEHRAEVREEGLDDDLLVPRADTGQTVAQAADGVAHHHKLTVFHSNFSEG